MGSGSTKLWTNMTKLFIVEHLSEETRTKLKRVSSLLPTVCTMPVWKALGGNMFKDEQ